MALDDYYIRDYRPEDLDEYLELYRSVFEAVRDDKWFRWKYEEPPSSENSEIIVAEHEGRIIGARSFFSVRMSCNNREYHALQPCDTMISPEHRRNGIFTRMNQKAIQKYENSDVRFFFNFPNKKALPGNLKMGWEFVQPLERHYRIQNPDRIAQLKFDSRFATLTGKVASAAFQGYCQIQNLRSSSISGLSIERYDHVPANEFSELHNQNRPIAIHAIRDETFYNWKFQNPKWDYRAYIARDNGESIAATIFASKSNGLNQTRIVESLPIQAENAPFTATECLYREAIVDHSQTDFFIAAGNAIPEKVLRRLGFLSDGSIPLSFKLTQKNMVARSLSGDLPIDLSNPDNWAVNFTELDTT
ncbi:GNAT family N-acetyltransferase [Natrononativus amylolyticus]|uniref:GNAT family N-acetyltransferase n=1 Tax=Natrononativus amylolyticus TaxID=2963434 RepID=UPI0020CF8CA5|nr:GNAT family N-acetyltransferase [Natrononativus amylolyticus]